MLCMAIWPVPAAVTMTVIVRSTTRTLINIVFPALLSVYSKHVDQVLVSLTAHVTHMQHLELKWHSTTAPTLVYHLYMLQAQ